MIPRAAFALSGLALLCTGCGQSASAPLAKPTRAEGQPAKLEGMAYDAARKVILGYGWTPKSGPCVAGEETCAKYPEIDACSLSLPVQCAMVFSRPNRCLIVSTSGEAAPGYEEGEPTVVDVTFQNKTCSR